MRRCLILFVLLVLALSACLGLTDSGIGLPKTSEGFGESMRWKDFQTASIYMKADVRDRFLEQFVEDEDLFIVESRVVKVDLHEEEGRADVVYQMQYYRLPSSAIKKWNWTQHWTLERGKATKPGVWLIENEPPQLPWSE